MKKILFSLILFLFIVPTVVLAEDKVEIKSITFVEKSENTKINTEASTDGEKINLDLVFYDKDDYATYKVVVKNTTNTKLFINDDYFNKDREYIYYDFIYNDGNNIVKPGEEKEILLKVSYYQEVPKTNFRSAKYEINNEEPLILSDKLINIPNTLKNLGILGICISIIFTLCIITGIFILIKNKKAGVNIIVISLLFISFPRMVDALLRIDIPVDSKITIKMVKDNPCVFEGNLTQGVTYINGQYLYTYRPQYTIYTDTIYTSTDYFDEGWGVKLTDLNSTDPVTTKLCTSINDKPIVSMENMFSSSKAEYFDLSSFDTSNVVTMANMFSGTSNNVEEASYIGIEYLDTSNVKYLASMFSGTCSNEACKKLELDLTRWDVRNVTHVNNLLNGTGNYADYFKADFSGWNLEKVKSIQYFVTYSGGNAKKYDLNISNINIPLVTSLNYSFGYIGIYSKELNMDVSNMKFPSVTTIHYGFYMTACNAEVVNLKGLDTWDVSTITDFSQLFEYFSNYSTNYYLDLSSWDVSNADTLYRMLHNGGGHTGTIEVNVSGWKIKPTANLADFMSHSYTQAEKATINMSNWDITGRTETGQIFSNLGSNVKDLTLDFSNWKTPDLVSMNYFLMGSGIRSVKKLKIDMTGWDTSKVTSMNYSFNGAGFGSDETEIVGLNDLNTKKVTSFYGTFQQTKNINFNNFHIYADTIDSMFYEAFNITGNIIIHKNPTSYNNAFNGTNNYNTGDDALLTVDYTSAVTNIDSLLLNHPPKVVKGSLVED
jgi:surface protein